MNLYFLILETNMSFYLFIQKSFPTSDYCSSLNHANTSYKIRKSRIRKLKAKKKANKEKVNYIWKEEGG